MSILNSVFGPLKQCISYFRTYDDEGEDSQNAYKFGEAPQGEDEEVSSRIIFNQR
jgi:hypothetical protein